MSHPSRQKQALPSTVTTTTMGKECSFSCTTGTQKYCDDADNIIVAPPRDAPPATLLTNLGLVSLIEESRKFEIDSDRGEKNDGEKESCESDDEYTALQCGNCGAMQPPCSMMSNFERAQNLSPLVEGIAGGSDAATPLRSVNSYSLQFLPSQRLPNPGKHEILGCREGPLGKPCDEERPSRAFPSLQELEQQGPSLLTHLLRNQFSSLPATPPRILPMMRPAVPPANDLGFHVQTADEVKGQNISSEVSAVLNCRAMKPPHFAIPPDEPALNLPPNSGEVDVLPTSKRGKGFTSETEPPPWSFYQENPEDMERMEGPLGETFDSESLPIPSPTLQELERQGARLLLHFSGCRSPLDTPTPSKIMPAMTPAVPPGGNLGLQSENSHKVDGKNYADKDSGEPNSMHLETPNQVGGKPLSPSRKPTQCPICERVLCRKSYLKTHMTLHSGERNLHCPVRGCNRVFRWPSNLSR